MKRECPYCGDTALCETVHNGVCLQQVGPFICEFCGSAEMGIHEDKKEANDYEKALGWWMHPELLNFPAAPVDVYIQSIHEARIKILRERYKSQHRSRLQSIE